VAPGNGETYTRGVLETLSMRNFVCAAPGDPAAFDVPAFTEKLRLGNAALQLNSEEQNVLISEYRDLRLQILPDRMQLGFKPSASRQLVRDALEEFAAITLENFRPQSFGFNAELVLQLADGEPSPVASVLDGNQLAAKLGGGAGRAGIWVVYEADSSRWWVELVPKPDDDRIWVYNINRHFTELPEGTERAELFSWFQDLEANLSAQYKALVGEEIDGQNGA
jgi:hypothetical protein